MMKKMHFYKMFNINSATFLHDFRVLKVTNCMQWHKNNFEYYFVL